MPHKQKENHDHSTKSKKERMKAKQDKINRKKSIEEARLAAELEAENVRGNIAPLAEGHGEYEIGCEPEREYKFNTNKRNKKYLFNDLRKKIERAERERLEREHQQGDSKSSSSSSEEDDFIEEYIIYICECCNKKFATQNQFVNHSNSKKHRNNAAIYEEAGVLVTGVELRGDDEDELCFDDYSQDEVNGDEDHDEWDVENNIAKEQEEEEEEAEQEHEIEQPKPNLFAAYAAFDDDTSSSSSSSSSKRSQEEEDEDSKIPHKQPPVPISAVIVESEESEDDVDLEEIIYQNQLLQSKIDTESATATIAPPPVPLPFDGQYDPDDYDVNENRLAAVQYRLQKRLAERGIEPNRIEAYASDAVSMGKTLLQQVMEANVDTLQAKLDAYNKHKHECELLGREFALAKGNSKALPAQYTRKQDTADDTRKRANTHHAGSHYHMQAARSMQFGRSKGLMARHSSQGARLQASRIAAKETARMQTGGGGMKVGKGSKKSNQKSQGEAGGSKKSGGAKGGGGEK